MLLMLFYLEQPTVHELLFNNNSFRHIMYTPVTEQEFLENLHELNHKMNFSSEQSMVDYKSFNDVSVLLKKLRIKVGIYLQMCMIYLLIAYTSI